MALTDEGLIEVPGMMSRWVRLGNGERAHYMTAGENGPSVVLLHGGIPGSSGLAGWRMFAPRLAEAGFRVYCPDQPGFGLSDPRPQYWPVHGPYTHADFVERFAEALCLDKFFLAGNSMGCLNTAHYVVRYPRRVERFILIAGPVGDLLAFGDEDLKSGIGWDGTRETMARMMKTIIHHSETITDDLLEMRMQSAEVHAQSWIALQRAVILGDVPSEIAIAMSTKDRLDRLPIPGLCLYGKNDAILPVEEFGHRVEEVLPKVQFFYPDDCGHQGQTDQPELFAQVFTEFFRNGKVTWDTALRAGVSDRRPTLSALVESGPIPAH